MIRIGAYWGAHTTHNFLADVRRLSGKQIILAEKFEKRLDGDECLQVRLQPRIEVN
jgi:hypothetical protein